MFDNNSYQDISLSDKKSCSACSKFTTEICLQFGKGNLFVN